ncbi:MAG: tRNA (guanosine(37)-N1)-methyltransferase TrmD [Candidatus Babeliales bacterium]
MKISVLTLFPQFYDPLISTSLIKRAQEKGLVQFAIKTFFDFVQPKERIDAPTFGTGAGMLIKPNVISKAIDQQDHLYGKSFKIFFSPQGKKLDQRVLKDLAQKIQETQHVLLVAPRYEGIDARVEEKYADAILSVGDFVLMGGDLPAMICIEGLLRYIPGIVGKEESVERDSFSGPFVDYPEYTEPVEWEGMKVPDIVRSGNHGAIERWRREQAAQKTITAHWGWFRSYSPLSKKDREIASQCMPKHYAVLMHDEIDLPDGTVGTTSITTIDIHDIARSARTYNLEHFFLVTSLSDQREIAHTVLNFWQEGVGISYNPDRHEAVKRVSVRDSLAQAVEQIERNEGKKPIIIATSARSMQGIPTITYHDQEKIWRQECPVLIIFGTGGGLAQSALEQADYILGPLEGLNEYNHLSVRSAAAVIFDRWLGLNPKNPR